MTDVVEISSGIEVVETIEGAIEVIEVSGGVTDHGALTGLSDDDHAQYHNDARGDARYALIAKGVTNGDSHDHSGGDGAQIAYSGLSGLPTLGSAAATDSTAYATAAQGSTADTALQPGDDAADLGSGAATDGYVLTADGAGGAAWEAAVGGDAATAIHAATEKTTPVNADELGLVDSAASWVLKKLSWGNLVARVKVALTYFKDATNFSIGSNSFAYLTTGISNTAVGTNAISNNTSGNSNTAIGKESLYLNTTGFANNACGTSSLFNNTDGFYNNAMGTSSLFSNNSGYQNNAMGLNALYSNTTGAFNTGVGSNAGYSNTIGTYNTCIGINSLYGNVNGNNNVAIGNQAGRYHANGSTVLTDPENSIYIGYTARGKDNADSNSIVIGGSTPIGLGANTTVIGTSATTLTRLFGNVATGVDSPSAAFHAIKTTEQLRLGYDATYYASFTVNSSGALTQTAVGGQTLIGGTGVASKIVLQGTSANGTSTAAALEMKVGNNGATTAMTLKNDGNIYIPGIIENTTSGEGIILKSPDGTRYKITVANGGTLSVSAA